MIYRTPSVTAAMQERLDELDGLRAELGGGRPTPWLGLLRRQVAATTVASSVAIEGYTIPDGDSPRAEGDEAQLAIACYARAMDHVGVMALDPVFRWLDRVILDLHFDACSFQKDKSPGRWRTGPIGVTGTNGGIVYRGPDEGHVVGLMTEVTSWLESDDLDTHVVVRAAMAHLHTVSVHPFEDGNGRISRIVQSLVLARDGLVSPEFGSIEEYLANHTPDYYAALEAVQAGSYQPERDATEWVGFCIDAHIAQARQRLRQISDAATRWQLLEELVAARGWPDRLVIALEQSLVGDSDRASYEAEAAISPGTASSDFRRLVDAGLVEQVGRGPTTRYRASDELRARVSGA